MATASEVRLSCGCADERHLGTSCSCMVCAEDPSSDHPTTPCPLPPEKRPEVVRQAAYQRKKQELEEIMSAAIKMANRLLYKETNCEAVEAGTGVLAAKLYDELKAAKAEADANQTPTPAEAASGDIATVAIIPVFVRDMRKEGWVLVPPHSPRRITSASDVELVSFLKSGEHSISGEEMARRARNELDANFGQEDADWLWEHQDQIPTEFRKFYLVFPGTVWRGLSGCRYVPCLYWRDKRWCLGFTWLEGGWSPHDWFGHDWGANDRLLRLSKSR